MYSLATSYVRVQIRPARNFITAAQLRARKIRISRGSISGVRSRDKIRFDEIRQEMWRPRKSIDFYAIDFRVDETCVLHI